QDALRARVVEVMDCQHGEPSRCAAFEPAAANTSTCASIRFEPAKRFAKRKRWGARKSTTDNTEGTDRRLPIRALRVVRGDRRQDPRPFRHRTPACPVARARSCRRPWPTSIADDDLAVHVFAVATASTRRTGTESADRAGDGHPRTGLEKIAGIK